jgi:hypothetical protein
MQNTAAPAALKQRVDKIRALGTPARSIPFLTERWKAKVPCAEVEYLIDAFPNGRISRPDLFALGQRAVAGNADDRRRLLVATLMWGYGSRGGRSYTNAKRVLAVTSLDRKLEECAAAIGDADVRAAFSAIAGLSGYGIGYFTKYLYFLAREIDWRSQTAKPLIFDSRVEDTLNFIKKALDVPWDAPLTGRRSAVARYLHYCETAQSWATELGLPPGVGGAEKIEQYLFEPEALWFDVDAEMRELASAVLRDCAEGSAGPHTRAAMVTMNTDLAQSFRSTSTSAHVVH